MALSAATDDVCSGGCLRPPLQGLVQEYGVRCQDSSNRYTKSLPGYGSRLSSLMPMNKRVLYHKDRHLIKNLDIHIKEVVLQNYRGKWSHVNFARFFALKAKMLASMILQVLLSVALASDGYGGVLLHESSACSPLSWGELQIGKSRKDWVVAAEGCGGAPVEDGSADSILWEALGRAQRQGPQAM
ncbi:hypothetical protein EJB05_13106, partial [Eragrostis curvula]